MIGVSSLCLKKTQTFTVTAVHFKRTVGMKMRGKIHVLPARIGWGTRVKPNYQNSTGNGSFCSARPRSSLVSPLKPAFRPSQIFLLADLSPLSASLHATAKSTHSPHGCRGSMPSSGHRRRRESGDRHVRAVRVGARGRRPLRRQRRLELPLHQAHVRSPQP
jgi:hypothetical protein